MKLGIAPSEFWGWPEEDQQLVQALQEYEDDLGPYGIPMSEAMSEFADPNNPKRKYTYGVKVMRNFAQSSVEEKQGEYKDDPSSARMFIPFRVDY